MRADRYQWWAVVGMAAAVVLAGCGGGGGDRNGAGVDRPAGEEPTTTAPATPPTTTAPPTSVAGDPRVTATPTRAPAGTRVQLAGDGFTGIPWQTAGGQLWLTEAAGQGGCDLVAEAEHDLQVTAGGHLAGSFVVPATGTCRFSAGNELNTGPLRYDIAYQCTACVIGSFTVILEGESMEEPTGEPCPTVAFGVQNVASDIYADGLPCDEAAAFLRANAAPWGPMSGPAHVEADGFTCDRTGRSDIHLPRANYKCTRDSEVIFFIRT
ncbi:MAG: hypothetical protein QOG82_2119 [Actinomycetota bacterium]|nr:hypothetical protein [Actinomycetota bacterium]